MTIRVEAKQASLKDLTYEYFEGFMGKIYKITLEVPAGFIDRDEPGQVMAYHVNQTNFYNFLLGVKRAYLNSKTGGIANVSVELGQGYVGINLEDLRKVDRAVILIPKDEE